MFHWERKGGPQLLIHNSHGYTEVNLDIWPCKPFSGFVQIKGKRDLAEEEPQRLKGLYKLALAKEGQEAHLVAYFEARFPAMFAKSVSPECKTNFVHSITLKDSKPIKIPPHRYSLAAKEAIKEFIEDGLKNGIIEQSSSPWSSPMHLVPKPNSKKRVTIDYQALNAVTEKDAFPVPRVEDLIENLRGAEYFTTIDFVSGFWQIKMDEASKALTTFSTPDGLYHFKVMPMGLCNAVATFQQAANDTLSMVLGVSGHAPDTRNPVERLRLSRFQ